MSKPTNRPSQTEEKEIIGTWLTEHGQGNLVVDRAVGRGGFSVCWLLVQSQNKKPSSVLKSVTWPNDTGSDEKRASYRTHVEDEIRVHSSLKHKNIVSFYRYALAEPFLFMFLEYCNRGSLERILRKRSTPLTEKGTRDIISQILSALSYLLTQKVIHRDVKPGNILMTIDREGNAVSKLGDFGLCIWTPNDERQTSNCGTLKFLAPEVLAKDYSYAVDIWALGITTHMCLFERTPYPYLEANKPKENTEETRKQLMTLVVKCLRKPTEYLEINRGHVSPACHDFMYQCLWIDQYERKTPDDLLAHGWITCRK